MDLYTARYMTRFRCLGAECEDNCCQGWRVNVDQKHYEALRARMSSPEEKAELAAGMRRVDDDKDKGKGKGKDTGRGHPAYALMVLRDDGRCSFLDDQGLCTIHARYGEELLADVCASYPRVLGRIGERLELVGTPSCPEIARQLLLHDDATERVPGDRALLGRGWISRAISDKPKDVYELNFLPVRGLVITLLRNRKYPLTTRLFQVAFFADRSRNYLRRNAERFDPQELQELGRALQVDENLAELHRQFRRSLADAAFAMEVVRGSLWLSSSILPPQLARLIGDIETFFRERGTPIDADPLAQARAYARLPPLPADQAERLETIVERYVNHHLINSWYIGTPSFVTYYHELLARVAVLRFLAISHAHAAPPPSLEELDKLLVRVVYLVSRIFEHSTEYGTHMKRALEQHGMTLGDAVALIRV